MRRRRRIRSRRSSNRWPRAIRAQCGACTGSARSRVFVVAKRIVGRHELADEIVSTTFQQIWRDAGSFDPARGSVVTWALTIGRSRALDLLRAMATRHRQEAPPEQEDPATVADSAPGPCANLQSTQVRALLSAALTRSTPIQRQVVCMTFIEGLSHDEVAARASLPLGTVKSHARRGLAALRGNRRLAAVAR